MVSCAWSRPYFLEIGRQITIFALLFPVVPVWLARYTSGFSLFRTLFFILSVMKNFAAKTTWEEFRAENYQEPGISLKVLADLTPCILLAIFMIYNAGLRN